MKTKQLVILICVSMSVAFAGCLKSDEIPVPTCQSGSPGNPTAEEMTLLQNHITSNGITATQHSSGTFFYRIIAQGSGATPTLANTVTVKYTGTLTNGTVFGQDPSGSAFLLSSLIIGWQRGLPLIQKGGSIILYLPPSLAYGCNASVPGIPAGSITIFSIELVDVQ